MIGVQPKFLYKFGVFGLLFDPMMLVKVRNATRENIVLGSLVVLLEFSIHNRPPGNVVISCGRKIPLAGNVIPA